MSDMVAQHYFNFNALGSTKILTETPDAHIFFHNGDKGQLWLFLPADLRAPVEEWASRHFTTSPPTKAFDSWSVNTFNKDDALTIYKNWGGGGFDLLYEMHRPAGSSPTLKCPEAFVVEESPSYWKKQLPETLVSNALMESETFLAATEVSTGKVVGFATYLADEKTKRVYVSGLEVYPQYRRKGLAKALMAYIISSQKEDFTVWLTVFAENVGALKMYFGLDFVISRCLWVVIGGSAERMPSSVE